MAQAAEEIPNLSALRGLAALAIFAGHYNGWLVNNLELSRWTGLADKFYLAVDLFFLMSGLIIAHVYGPSFGRLGGRAYGDFLVLRLSRLYPLHLLVLGAVLAIALIRLLLGAAEALPPWRVAATLGEYLTLTHAWGTQAPVPLWNHPSWSISTEWAAYLVFPLLFPLLGRGGRPAQAAVAAGCLAGLVWLAGLDPVAQLDRSYDLGLLRCLFGFWLGVLLQGRYAAWRERPLGRLIGGDAVLLGLGLLLLILLQFRAPDLLSYLLLPPLVLAAALNRGRLGRLLEARPLRWLGEISYALYMIHALLLGLFLFVAVHLLGFPFGPGQALLWFLLLAPACLLSAHLVNRQFERPARLWLRRLRPRGGTGGRGGVAVAE
ncbi:Peptidoglycan/LPS O-acetylase OafA/YrhL, contains acyltransferase and SGNH-hydrolase domains [Tistlia consotensis]|uniref:Peptidoglycan/LPS O-acetylase OafA/YrhL, contains acyltransferase and SGNH-hydrolase domains n=1 Tax=Tistlia consotensis USBA 355 TaxID=560819 RepID=A0A1Y6CGB5_9PROT|nr:acyltransferase [Tistlia consotensis]SMF63362.1 Peptidoglycan/LPS O-acetylase OafA/YrhL, contains acyltransferase and SGNH-hydrolase domains [Tistlia consotensis USBA 355]SNR96069.1 Peptidoglycan/LPS O-acetylase OafA/YrhL, contains acyltransferase and SGNH-hydrolase domains [Tistlia consotensis]